MAKKESEDRDFPEELTTDMHSELMEGEMTALELKCLAVWSRVHKSGESMKDALKYVGITQKEYDDNIESAFKA